jgi:hypothetical protein
MYIYYKLLNTAKEKKKELRKLKLQQPLMATSDEVLLKHVHIPSVRLFFASPPTQLESYSFDVAVAINGPSHFPCILPFSFPFGTLRSTRSPDCMSFGLIFLFFHLRVSSW